jgi:hypothetical protein
LVAVAATLRTHLLPTSVWFRNSLRAALALGLAVLLTRITRVEHSFWVVLGTLSVLRSNALGAGRTALLAIGGTVVGFVIAAVLTLAIGTSAVALWVTLPIVAFLAAYVPTAVSFLVGQAAFTLFVVVLFNLLQPQLQQRRAPPAPRVPAAAATRDAVVGCLRAWRGAPGSPLGPTAIALTTAWFWSVEIARLGGELAQPLAAVAAAAQSPWWR